MNNSKYIVGNKAFSTKKSVEEYAKHIKNTHKEFEPITDEESLIFLTDLIRMHPKAAEKVGAGIEFIMVGCNEKTRTREFQLCRIDGSKDNFSPKKCIYKETPNAGLYEACRDAIKGQTSEFRREQLQEESPICPFRKTALTHKNSHVDHVQPKTFQALVKQWLEQNGLELNMVELHDTGAMKAIADEVLRNSWEEYHRSNSKLCLVSIEANLSECKVQT